MNVVGLVTEHNPFHNGHLYHVKKAREQCEADYVVSVMSGHFLQRGEPALFNKWARAKMAVQGGVDIVIELPVAYSVRSATDFAYGAVSLLNSTGVVTHLCFGSEAGELDDLWPAARLLKDEPERFKILLAAYLTQGLPYPTAMSKAVSEYLSETGTAAPSVEIYKKPNNILGIEYLKSILKLHSDIKPFTIKRYKAGYHDQSIPRFSPVSSATSIREELQLKGELTDSIKSVVPQTTFWTLNQEIAEGRGPVFIDNYYPILFYLLRTVSKENLKELYDVREGLENRILEAAKSSVSVKNLIEKVKTKRYTWTRIQRILTYCLLGYTKSKAAVFDSEGPKYVRVLGLSPKGRDLIKIIKKQSEIPVITRTKPFLSGSDKALAEMLSFDIKATDIYTLLCNNRKASLPGMDLNVMPYVGN